MLFYWFNFLLENLHKLCHKQLRFSGPIVWQYYESTQIRKYIIVFFWQSLNFYFSFAKVLQFHDFGKKNYVDIFALQNLNWL